MIEIYEGKTLLFRFTLNQISIAKNTNKFVLNFLPPVCPKPEILKMAKAQHTGLSHPYSSVKQMLLIFQSFCGKFILWKIQEQKIYIKKKFKKDVIDFLRYEGKKRKKEIFALADAVKCLALLVVILKKKYLSINATCELLFLRC